jgi:hypothetical protein
MTQLVNATFDEVRRDEASYGFDLKRTRWVRPTDTAHRDTTERFITICYLIAGKLKHLLSNPYIAAPQHIGSMECSPLKRLGSFITSGFRNGTGNHILDEVSDMHLG